MSVTSKELVSRLPKKVNYLARRIQKKMQHGIEDLTRALYYDPKSQPFVNKREVRVIGLRRSGNHAIINWIGKQAKGNVAFINHVRPLENPYRIQYENQILLEQKLPEGDWKYKSLDWWRKEKEGNFSRKDCLIYSYEDQELAKVASQAFERKHDLYLGKSEERYDVIIMRDPFNLFASRLQTKPRKSGPNFSMLKVYSQKYSLAELWVCYAKECLGDTCFLRNKRIFINYNQWFVDVSYRESIANQLGIDFTDEGFNDVSISGRGSSFDGIKYAGQTYKMDVLNRWKLYSNNAQYRALLNTDGLLEYSAKIFGEIPGTEALFS